MAAAFSVRGTAASPGRAVGPVYLAAGRGESGLASYPARSAPVVLSVIATAVGHAARPCRPIAFCGAMAGLLAAGLRHFSVALASVPVVRSVLAALNADGTKATGD